MEADDPSTIRAIQTLRLSSRYELIRAPAGNPRTKPRALNIALPEARGSLLVVYDAEDRPEAGQLRHAARCFAASPATLACLQGSLVIDNVADSWLTRLFAIEYETLFDVLNPGMARISAPIPLGGTSNHFRVSILREATGWDAWNVTEDIDLGIRLARMGYRISTIPVVTDEEAPSTLVRWFGQRRRWLKGWMQTLLTHSRDPGLLARELGTFKAIATLSMVAGGLIGPLLGPVFGVFAVLDAVYGNLLSPQTLLELLQSTCWIFVGFAGVVAAVWPAVLGMMRRGLLGQAAWLLAMPAYYILLTIAAWAALYDFFRSPYHWSKTQHGLARTSRRRPAIDANGPSA